MPSLFTKRSLLQLLAAALVAPLSHMLLRPAHAAPEPILPAEPASAMPAGALQIVVFEAPGCIYCNLFRRHVLPAYTASPRASDIPLRFLDLNEDAAVAALGLDGAIDTVPTAVLLHNNREIGRIPGYVGPENFFHAVSHLLAQVE